VSEFRARISRVRLKNGGCDVRILDNRALADGGEDNRGAIMACARNVGMHHTDTNPLVGYIVAGVFKDGSYSFGYRWGDEVPIPSMMLPTWLGEVARREVLMGSEAEHVFRSMFEWVEG
jgi:hypothetical protein